jgi:hypothetical protein
VGGVCVGEVDFNKLHFNWEMGKIDVFLRKLEDKELLNTYSKLLFELKKRKMIRTNNLVGDIGEFIVLDYFNSKENYPDLVQAETNEKAYDAFEKENRNIKYAIKSTSTKMTGIFWGLEPKGSKNLDTQIFNFVIVVKFDKNYSLQSIYQIDWNDFQSLKSWHSMTNGWKLSLTRRFESIAKLIYNRR